MSYLYGDSTPTELKSNFLEFLRDAVDFAVFVLEADSDIKNGKVRIQKNTEAMEAEIGRLEGFIGVVSRSIREAEKGSPDSATAACATHVEKLVAEAQRTSVTSMRARLAHYVAKVNEEEAATRAACFKALETLLAPHDPPHVGTVTRIVLLQSGQYDAAVDGRSNFGLAWTFALAIPDGNPWSVPIRIERLVQNLEIRAPQLSGWISKEVKVRPQKLDRHVVTDLVSEDGIVRMKLRAEPGVETGFDFSIDLAGKKVDAKRTGTAEGDASIGAFDVAAEDVSVLVDLATKLNVAASELTRRELTAATWRDGNFHEVPTFSDVVEQLVGMMAPITREISSRSLKPTELVLRRMLANDRREEVFVEKATLREKYETLAPPLREYFRPLGFDPPAPPPVAATVSTATEEFAPASAWATSPPETLTETASEPPAARAELPRSQRPPPLPAKDSDVPIGLSPEPFGTAPSAPPDSGPAVEISMADATSVPPGSTPPASEPPTERSSEPPLEITRTEPLPIPPPVPDVLSPPPPESSQNPIAKLDKDGASKNVELIGTLKKIVSLSRSGKNDDAFKEYHALFSSPAFADYRPEDQRQALKLMVLAKTTPPKNDFVLDAYRAALTRLQVLTDALGEPADFEMLGAAHVMFDNVKAANDAFARALEIERSRNPSSELIGKLMSRVAAL